MHIINNDKSEIVLFNLESSSNTKSYLKDFINCLKFQGLRPPIKFSFVEQNASLIDQLSLRDNILLDSIPNSLSSSKEFQLMDYLNHSGNLNLIKLFKQVPNWDQLARNASNEDKKLACIIKAMIHTNEIIFLELPEKFLAPFQIKMLIKTIEYKINNSKRLIFLRSDIEGIWSNIITKTIIKSKNGRFEVHDYQDTVCDTVLNNDINEQGYLIFNNLTPGKNKAA